MNRKWNILIAAGIAFTLLVSSGLVGASSPSPLADDVRAIMTAVAGGADADPLLDRLAAKYEGAQPQAALVDAANTYVELDGLTAGIAPGDGKPAFREEFAKKVDPNLLWAEVDSAPEKHAGAPVCWRGSILTVRQVKDQTYFQAYHENSTQAFVAFYEGAARMAPGDEVRVCGEVVGPWSGKNAFGTELRQTLVRARILDLPAAPGKSIPGSAAAVEPAAPSEAVLAANISCQADALFGVDLTVPDHTVVRPGQTFDKVWRMKNAGTCAWDQDYRWAYVGGHKLGTVEAVSVPATAPGRPADLKVAMAAPKQAGVYQAAYRMMGPDGKPFGAPATVIIDVVPEGAPLAAPKAAPKLAPKAAAAAKAEPAAPALAPRSAPATKGPQAVAAPIVPMAQAFWLGPWQIRAVELNRETDVWKNDNHWAADGAYALVRLKVTYSGNETGYMSEQLTFQARDDQDRLYTMAADSRAGDAARWMVANHASTSFNFQPGTTDWPVLIAFDVEQDVKELYLTVTTKDKKAQGIIHLQPTESKSAGTYTGSFETAIGLD